MVDSNGYVDPSHLAMFAGVQVSKALVPLLTPAMDDFQARGFTFRAALPWGGYRPFGVQAGMKANPAAYGSSMEPGQIADAGKSTHGFGLSFDLVTNAPLATAVALMTAHGFDRPIAGDPNHYQPVGVNVLASPSDAAFASTNQQNLTTTTTTAATQEEIDDMAANQNADVVRDYETEGKGIVRTALLFPWGDLVQLNASVDVDSAVSAHVKAFNLPMTNPSQSTTRTRYGAQLTKAEYDAFVALFPGRKIGF